MSAIKKQEAAVSVKNIAREMGISDATFYNWKAKYGGMKASDVSKMRDVEKENAELKKILAEISISTCRECMLAYRRVSLNRGSKYGMQRRPVYVGGLRMNQPELLL